MWGTNDRMIIAKTVLMIAVNSLPRPAETPIAAVSHIPAAVVNPRTRFTQPSALNLDKRVQTRNLQRNARAIAIEASPATTRLASDTNANRVFYAERCH